ncbi:ATPase [Maridesulfovibrio sp. FT414]|uniref:F0F1 ATP synthase subunit B family protein n=1 Tax=Maridesulfovibrio sp. FT414 TaxID=2979469 RepID=UPI003D809F45
MLLDWFTIFAQILNFFVLMVLLKLFLYGPIVNAMQARKEQVAAEMAGVRAARAEAEALSVRLDSEREELDERAAEVMARIHAESEEWRRQAEESARAEIETMRDEWLAALGREKEAVALNLRKRLVHEVAKTAARMVRDLADSELEEFVLGGFIRKIATEASGMDCGSCEILVRTGFEQTPAHRHKLETILADLFPSGNELVFLHVPKLGLGMELIAGDRKWEWNLASYTEELERKILDEIRVE